MGEIGDLERLDELFGLIAEHAGECGVDHQDVAGDIGDADPDTCLREHRAKQFCVTTTCAPGEHRLDRAGASCRVAPSSREHATHLAFTAMSSRPSIPGRPSSYRTPCGQRSILLGRRIIETPSEI